MAAAPAHSSFDPLAPTPEQLRILADAEKSRAAASSQSQSQSPRNNNKDEACVVS